MTKHNFLEKFLSCSSVKYSMGFLIGSCTLGQVGKWFKPAFDIFALHPMPHFIFFVSVFPPRSFVPLDCPDFHSEMSSSGLPSCQRPMYQDFLSQYVLVCTLLPKGFAYLFSIHMVNKSVLGCFGCVRNFMKIISWPFIHYSFKFSVIKRDFFFLEMSDILTPFTFLYIGYFLLQLNPQL